MRPPDDPFEDPYGLVRRLRGADFRITIDQELRLLRLMGLLGHQSRLASRGDLTNWLAPVLCTRPDERARLDTFLRQQFPTDKKPDNVGEGEESPVDQSVPKDRVEVSASDLVAGDQSKGAERSRWRWGERLIIAVVLLSILSLGLIFVYGLSQAVAYLYNLLVSLIPPTLGIFKHRVASSSTEYSFEEGLLAVGVTLPTLLTLAAMVYRRRRLALRATKVASDPVLLSVPTISERYPEPQLLHAARVLNRPIEKRSQKFDLISTIRSTAAAAGRFVPRSKIRRVPADWIVLVERAGTEDPLMAFAGMLSKLFERTRVRHSLYEFRRSATWVRRAGPRGRGLPIEQAISLGRPTRSLIIAEASRLLRPNQEELADWVTNSDLPSPIFLLTPKPRENWGHVETMLAQSGIMVFPANAEGLTSLARRLEAEDLKPDLPDKRRIDEFDDLQAERFTWLSQIEPSKTKRARLTDYLRQILLPEDFKLLAAIAAFPVVRLDLVSMLDATLHPFEKAAQRGARVLRIGRVVWLKEGFFPKWLRSDLLSILPKRDLEDIRKAWWSITDRFRQADPLHSSNAALHLSSRAGGSELRGDDLFLDLYRGEFDMEVPRRLARVVRWWPALDRIEAVIAVAGLVIALLAYAVWGDILPWIKSAQVLWSTSLSLLQQTALKIGYPVGTRLSVLVATIPLIISILEFMHRAGVHSVRAPLGRRPLASIVSVVSILGAGLAIPTDVHDTRTEIAAFTVALVTIACFLLPARPSTEIKHTLQEIIQRGRGAGLGDSVTLAVLVSYFISGALYYASDSAPISAWVVALAILGLIRSSAITATSAQLQSFGMPISLQLRVVAGLLLAQAVAASLFLMFAGPPEVSLNGPPDLDVKRWHTFSALQLIGSGAGALISLCTYWRVLKPRPYAAAIAGAALAHIAQAILVQFAGSDSPVATVVSLVPLSTIIAVVVLIGEPSFQQRGPVLGAVGLLVLSCLPFISQVILDTPLSYVSLMLCLLAGIATWPLVQRAMTQEPSIADEAPFWRPSTPPRLLWIFSPGILLLTQDVDVLGNVRLDLISLAIPVAAILGWRFGLRGWRTTLLMSLAMPVLVHSKWLSTASLDISLTCLLISALFARADSLSRILTQPRLGIGMFAASTTLLALNVDFPPGALPGGDLLHPFQLLWRPNAFLVAVLFIYGMSSFNRPASIVLLFVILSGLASYELGFRSVDAYVVRPIPELSAVAGGLAYFVGRYFRRSGAVSERRNAQSNLDTVEYAFLLVGAGCAAIATSLPFGDAGLGFLALSALFALTAAIKLRRDQSHLMVGVGFAGLTGIGIAGPWTGSLSTALSGLADGQLLPTETISPLLGSTFAFLVPAIFFAIGRQCRTTVLPMLQTSYASFELTKYERSASLESQAALRIPSRLTFAPSTAAERDLIPNRRRLVVLIDEVDTGGASLSNVAKLYLCLKKADKTFPRQVVRYIGSAPPMGNQVHLAKRIFKELLSTAAVSRDSDIIAAYDFLIENYQQGDAIYLFGLGSGARAIRTLAGLIQVIGLIAPQQRALSKVALACYAAVARSRGSMVDPAKSFSLSFTAHRPPIDFVGVWDTTTTAFEQRRGRPFSPNRDGSASAHANPSVKVFRQALALDERGRRLRPDLWPEPQIFEEWRPDGDRRHVLPQDIQQVWFAGTHRDIGGEISEEANGLSKFPLIWMIDESSKHGLLFDRRLVDEVAWGLSAPEVPFRYAAPNLMQEVNSSVPWAWRLLEILPKHEDYKEWPQRTSEFGYYLPNSEPREVRDGALVHESVIQKLRNQPSYRPVNVPRTARVVPMAIEPSQLQRMSDR